MILSGNTGETKSDLFPYGIQTEQSDIRAHVAVAAKRVLVFKTPDALRIIETRQYPQVLAFQDGIEGATAQGYLIPIEDVSDLRVLWFLSYQWQIFPARTANTSERGKAAVAVICELLQHGRFPLWLNAVEENDTEIQLQGTDIIVAAKKRIQVKCDWFAGKKKWAVGCTGNLFIQTAERNPLKRI